MLPIILKASDEEVVKYLTILWSSKINNEQNTSTIQSLIDNKSNSTEINETDFKKQIKENLVNLRKIGFRVYNNINLEKEVNLIPKTVTTGDIDKVYIFKSIEKLNKNDLMKDISHCTIFPKHKKGDCSKPENFRYLVNHHNTIKILDRLWCLDLINKIKDNMPDQNIFIANLLHRYTGSTMDVAINNTQSIDYVVLLDIEKAFDSLEWDILENLLFSNLSRKSNSTIAKELVDQYMIILKNRELYYNKIKIKISKGISTGLPSSNLVFILAIEEIIHRWLIKTKLEINKDFVMNIYVDDIYIKIIDLTKTSFIVNSLIDYLLEYQLYVNKNKSRVDDKLSLDLLNKLKPTDYYLGIPFTRDIKLYGKTILKEFQNNKLNWNWEQIYSELCKDNSNKKVLENQRIIIGFMNYKLKPFLVNNDKTAKEKIKDFIFTNWVKDIKNRRIYSVILTFIAIITTYALSKIEY